MVVDIDPERLHELSPLVGNHVREIALRRLTRLLSRRQLFELSEDRYAVLVEWEPQAAEGRDGGEHAQRISDALTADLSPGIPGIPVTIGYADGTDPLGLVEPAGVASRRAAMRPAYDCALPIVRPNTRIERGQAVTTSID
ncbi:hypothetical protein GWI34_10050 [Actinomadura sp. DSM 109109]|nr:hypothetical protein [Actinomadura lepetitiana]